MGVSLRGVSLFVSRMLLPSFDFLPQKLGVGLSPPAPLLPTPVYTYLGNIRINNDTKYNGMVDWMSFLSGQFLGRVPSIIPEAGTSIIMYFCKSMLNGLFTDSLYQCSI